MQNTLHLSVKKEWFDVMVTGEKKEEFRNNSDWIRSRLWQKRKHETLEIYDPKEYSKIKITNGYGENRPYFIAVFRDFLENIEPFERVYSNGAKIAVKNMDYIIRFDDILEIGNIVETRKEQ
jgi:hypothetical protein